MSTGSNTRRLYPDINANNSSLVMVCGSFELDGNDNDPINARGDGFVVSHSGGNDYLITFSNKYPLMYSFVATLEEAAADGAAVIDATVSVEPYIASAGTIILRVATESTGVLTKSDVENGPRVNFVAFFQKYNALSVTHA